MTRRFSYLFAGAAFALYASLGAAAFADPAPAAASRSQTIVRTDAGGQTHEVTVVKDASGKTIITRDGQTTVIDPKAIADQARAAAMDSRVLAMRHVDRAQHLRNALQLRPNQEPALQAYLAAIRPERTMIYRSADGEAQTTPERLADMEKALADHEAQVRSYIAATRAFYGQLDPAQRKAFDELHMAGDHMRMIQDIGFVRNMHMPPMPPLPPVPPVPPLPPAPPPSL